MGQPVYKNRFQLEGLEPRVLLSGDPVGISAAVAPVNGWDSPLEEQGSLPAVEESLFEDFQETRESGEEIDYDPASSLEGMFEGLPDDLLAETDDNKDDVVAPQGYGPQEKPTSGDESENLFSDFNEDSNDIIPAFEFSLLEAQLFVEGMERFFCFLDFLENDETLSQSLGVSGEVLTGFGNLINILDTRLQKAVYDFFGDAVDPPEGYGASELIQSLLAAGAADQGLPVSLFNLFWQRVQLIRGLSLTFQVVYLKKMMGCALTWISRRFRRSLCATQMALSIPREPERGITSQPR